MARPIDYTPHATPPDEAEAELRRVAKLLHERGVLRLVEGLLARFDKVSKIGVDQLDSPAGRRGLFNAIALSRVLTAFDSDQLRTLLDATGKGLGAAKTSLGRTPPSTWGLMKMLGDADTRRGIAAVLTLLATIGRELREEETSIARR